MESDSDHQQGRKQSLGCIHNFSSLLTNHSFDENPLETFQNELSDALSQILAESTTVKNGVHSVDSTGLEQSLEHLDWNTLMEQRDDRVKQHQSRSHDFETPFDLLLSCWKNSTLWPPACNACLVKVILKKLLSHRSGARIKRIMRCGKLDWTPSSLLLLDFLIAMMKQQPSLQAIKINEYIRTNLHKTTDPETINVAISIVKELIRNFPSRSILFIPLFLDLLCFIEVLVIRNRSSYSHTPNETKQRLKRRTDFTHGDNLAILHGECSDHEGEVYQNSLLTRFATKLANAQPIRVERKNILRANTALAAREMTADRIVFLGALRTKCLKSLVSSSKDSSTSIGSGAVNSSLFQAILDLVERWSGPETMYARLATLLWVSVSSHPNRAYQKLIEVLWLRTDNTNDPCAYLSFYVELLIESQFFDNQAALAQAVLPLCDRLKMLILDHEKSNVESALSALSILHSVSFLLAYRGNMLRQIPGFEFLLAQLSVEFTSPKKWLLPNTISSAERLKLLTSLESSGIFGIEEDENEVIQQTKIETWFYDPHGGSTVRACRFLSSLVPLNFFSPWSPTNSNPKPVVVGGKIEQSTCPQTRRGFSFGDLGDDMLREVFSFLGFKRIVFNRQVCKRWKYIGDDESNTWRPLYLARFGVDSEDLMLSASATLPWKQLFMQRWTSEKEIRFKRDKNGWKWRLCRRIGCLTVHNSPLRLIKHQSTHQINLKKRKRTRRNDFTENIE